MNHILLKSFDAGISKIKSIQMQITKRDLLILEKLVFTGFMSFPQICFFFFDTGKEVRHAQIRMQKLFTNSYVRRVKIENTFYYCIDERGINALDENGFDIDYRHIKFDFKSFEHKEIINNLYFSLLKQYPFASFNFKEELTIGTISKIADLYFLISNKIYLFEVDLYQDYLGFITKILDWCKIFEYTKSNTMKKYLIIYTCNERKKNEIMNLHKDYIYILFRQPTLQKNLLSQPVFLNYAGRLLYLEEPINAEKIDLVVSMEH